MQIIIFFLLVWPLILFPRQTTIMLDPAGDAKRTGRRIEDSLERAITMQLAQELKTQLEQLGYSIIISRMLGETREPLQTVQFANRLPIDFYIHLGCCVSPEETVSLYCYQFSYNEPFRQTFEPLSFVPLSSAHHVHFDQTAYHAQCFTQHLQKKYAHQFHTYGPYQLPLCSLYGIKAPALSLEFLLPHKDDWKTILHPVIDALKVICP